METKPGLRTTEFWLTILVNVGALLAALAGGLSPRWAAIASAASTGAYALARGWSKSGLKPEEPGVGTVVNQTFPVTEGEPQPPK